MPQDTVNAVLPCEAVLEHVVDVHCHPTDSPSTLSPDTMHRLPITICPMSTRQSDQQLVRNLAVEYPEKVIPCFGYHPWFTHIISVDAVKNKEDHYRRLFLPDTSSVDPDREDIFNTLLATLPDPIVMTDVMTEMRANLSEFPNSMVGEIGLDRSFRVPIDYSASPRQLTPFTVPIEHQLIIAEAQVDLAVEMGRNISFHSVKAQQATIELMQRMQKKHGERFNTISADMHSCGWSPETLVDVQNKFPNVFLSLSTAINARSPNHRKLITVCAPDRLLVESDFHDIEECTKRVWEMVTIVSEVKGWTVETQWTQDDLPEEEWGVVRTLERNFRLFQAGNHSTRKRAKKPVHKETTVNESL